MFIKAFGKLELVIIDGDLRTDDVNQIKNLVNGYNPKIKTQAKADTTYEVVNAADHIAYLLHMFYVRVKNGKEKKPDRYKANLIEIPSVDECRELLKQ